MQIYINERSFELEKEVSLAEALELLNLMQKGTAVAVNSVVIPYEKWGDRTLKENDEVMIIRATQGG